MAEIEAFETENGLDDLLDRVERGEEIVIKRRGKPVARLAPLAQNHDRDAALAALARIVERSKSVSLGGITIRELIDEGRR